MRAIQLGDSEYLLKVEEMTRECVPAVIGISSDENEENIAGIIVKQYIKDKDLYTNADINVRWEAVRNGNIGIEKIFLVVTFVDKYVDLGKMNFCFDLKDPFFREHMTEWFSMIIKKRIIDICDGNLPSITLGNIPLDMPELIIMTGGDV